MCYQIEYVQAIKQYKLTYYKQGKVTKIKLFSSIDEVNEYHRNLMNGVEQ